MVPSTVVMPREGSFALASFGSVRKVRVPAVAVGGGLMSFDLGIGSSARCLSGRYSPESRRIHYLMQLDEL